MRRKPISRDEVRFNGKRITTMPLDSVRKNPKHYWRGPEPIAELWAPLLRSLNRTRNREWNSRTASREEQVALGIRGHKKPSPIHAPSPPRYADPCKCEQCSRKFWRTRLGSRRWCSDVCAEEAARIKRNAGNADRVREKSEARAAARADRQCQTCGEPITAKRSTMRFCSVRCRVAAHRNGNI
jgi:hypothetical protein